MRLIISRIFRFSEWFGKGLIPAAFFAAIFLYTAIAHAQEMKAGGWTITADRMVSFDNPARTVAEGNVIMEYFKSPGQKPVTILADSITHYSSDSLVSAKGNVRISDGASKISAREATINLADQTGALKEAAVEMDGQDLHFTGRAIEKTGEDTFRLTDTVITACRPEGDKSPDWSIHCSEAEITVDGMAYLKHSSLWAKKLPILYSPFMILPAKVTRASGFLFPEISHSSRSGTGIVTPYFINLSPSSDITLYPGYFSKRGALTGINIRHVFDFNSLFAIGGSYLRDKSEDAGPPFSNEDYRKDGYLRMRKNRYWLRGMADHAFSDRLSLKTDLDIVSDQDFLHEFRESIGGFDKSNREMMSLFQRSFQEASLDFRESIVQLAARGEQTSGGMELRYTDDTLSDYSDLAPFHTLPRIVLDSRLPLSALGASFGLDSEYVNYYRKEGFGYHRFNMTPRLIAPVPLGRHVEGTVSAGFHETLYQIENYGETGPASWTGADNSNRNALDISANAATVLIRNFRPNLAKLKGLQHTFRPNLRYSYLYTGDQSKFPNLDNDDRITPENQLTWELNNYFLINTADDKGNTLSRNLGSLKLNQSFNIKEARRETTGVDDKRKPLSGLNLDVEVYPLANLYFHYLTTLDVYGNGVTKYLISSTYSNSRSDSFTLDYNYIKGSTRDLTTTAQVKLHRLLSARYSTTRSLLTDHKTNESLGLIYTPECWELAIDASQDSEDKRILLTLSLTGIGEAWKWNRSNL